MAFSVSMRKVGVSSASAGPRCTQRRVLVRAAASSTDVPPNVAEARAWIAAWRAKQQPQQPEAASGNGKPVAAAAPKASKGAKGGSKFGASAAMPDGTLVFTADQLKSVDYSDVKLKGKGK